MSRRRQLTDEEQALWSGFARSIAPLRQQKKSGKATMSDDRPASEPAKPNDREPKSGGPSLVGPTLVSPGRPKHPKSGFSRRRRKLRRSRLWAGG